MELLIDTWNVLHQTGILPQESAGIGTRGLVRMIKNSRWGRDKATLICDGTPSDSIQHGVLFQIVFTGAIRSADDEIIGRVTNSSSARSILVITSDRAIIRVIKAAGAQHMSSTGFLQLLVDDNNIPAKRKVHRPMGLSSDGVDEWKGHFGIDEHSLKELSKSIKQESPKSKQTKSKNNPSTTLKEKSDEIHAPHNDTPKKRVVDPCEPLLPPGLLEEARRLLDPDA